MTFLRFFSNIGVFVWTLIGIMILVTWIGMSLGSGLVIHVNDKMYIVEFGPRDHFPK